MAAAVLYLVVDNYVLEKATQLPVREIDDMSVAVLPFVPLSSGEDDGYFADGLTEEILNSLAQLPELRGNSADILLLFQRAKPPCA